ncbi:MAG: rhomboid family intramembrane serine protease [Chloroflexota bacterium]|nr:rhomboid family intramembrane serine protease [Chloroflexota bacterium]
MRTYRTPSLNALWFLITLNVVIFIITLTRPEDVYSWLGLSTASFLHQPWTIITNLFVHGGFGHIFCNMISLFFLGRFVIQLIGENRFLIVYFLGGIVGNILFMLLAPRFAIAIGASGAIFSLGGILAMIAPKMRVFIIPIPIPIPLWIAIAIFLLISFLPGIAWQAHLGGLLVGLGAGFYFRKKRPYFR